MAARTEEERLQALEILRNSYEMYERSKAETIKIRKEKKDPDGNRMYTDKSLEDTLELMETMQKDIKQQYLELGGNEEELYKKTNKRNVDRKALLQAIESANQKDAMKEYIEKIKKNECNTEPLVPDKEVDKATTTKKDGYKVSSKLLETETEKKAVKKVKEQPVKPIEVPENHTEGIRVSKDTNTGYDVIKLPSKGECYKNKMKEIEVNYLTAYDENLILSPNLYRNGTFLDHILRNKIRTDIDPDTLIQGDRDAIIIWLRASGYGNEYPVRITDDKTDQEFDSVVDLSKLNYKKFTLKGDENGYFDYTLPNSGDVIKFRFLTNADAKKINEMRADEDKEIKITNLKRLTSEFRSSIIDNDLVSDEQYDKIKDSIDNIENIVLEEYKDVPETYYNHDLTNRLILATVAINGNTDREYIVNYILNMNVKDAVAYRTYIIENEPGIDYNVKVQRPDSLGGGYIDTFLRLDQFIFIS